MSVRTKRIGWDSEFESIKAHAVYTRFVARSGEGGINDSSNACNPATDSFDPEASVVTAEEVN